MGIFRTIAALVVLGAFSLSTQAATFSYLLNEKNGGTEAPPYLEVTQSDSVPGTVDFIVDLVNQLVCGSPFSCNNYGIQEFGFNLAPGANTPDVNTDFTLPTDWTATIKSGGSQMDGFGKFDIFLSGPKNGNNRQNPTLLFSIAVAGNDVFSYFDTNSNGSHSAAQVSGDGPGNAYYSDSGVSVIPVPAAFWLFGTALIGFVGMSRRTRV